MFTAKKKESKIKKKKKEEKGILYKEGRDKNGI